MTDDVHLQCTDHADYNSPPMSAYINLNWLQGKKAKAVCGQCSIESVIEMLEEVADDMRKRVRKTDEGKDGGATP